MKSSAAAVAVEACDFSTGRSNMADKLFNVWENVPDRSKLVISTETKDSNTFVVATLDGIFVLPSGKIEEKVSDVLNAATGDPESINCRSPRRLVIDVIHTFVTDATVTVKAHIQPTGGGINKPFVSKLTRKKGAVEAVTLMVLTA
jgi:hypothetical protein